MSRSPRVLSSLAVGFRSLTVRGRGFLTSGITAAVCGIVLLERDLVRVGVLVAVVPLAALGFVLAARPQLQVERTSRPEEISVGETGLVMLSITNAGRQPGTLLVEEQIPHSLGNRPRFALPRLDGGQSTRLEYEVHPELRGRYRLGPVEVRHREPFGMMELRREVPGTHELLVLPAVLPLPAIRLLGEGNSSGEEHPRAYSTGTVADAAVRTYRRGDDLRRVHWPTTARLGELMVRNEEQLWQPRATVLLDDRAAAHRGAGGGSSLETAVTVAASVVAHLADRGYHVRLVTGSGTYEAGTADAGYDAGVRAVLAELAGLALSESTTLPDVPIDDELVGGVVVAVLGTGVIGDPVVLERDRQWWSRFSMVAGQSLAIALDTAGWGGRAQEAAGGRRGAATTWLEEIGWRAELLVKGDDVAGAWERFDA